MRESMPEGAFLSLQAAILMITNISQATMYSIFRSYSEIYALRPCTFLGDRHVGNGVQLQRYLLLISKWLPSPYYVNLWC